MATIEAQGTTFKIGDGASPEVFTAVGQVVSIGGPSGSATVIDVSNLSSTRREKRMGLADEGQINLTLQFDPDDTKQTALRTARANRAQTNFQIEMADGSPATTLSFAGFVLEFSYDFSVDQVVQATVTIEITGAVTES